MRPSPAFYHSTPRKTTREKKYIHTHTRTITHKMYPKSKIYRLNEIASIYIYVFGEKGISPLEEGRLIFRVQIVGPRLGTVSKTAPASERKPILPLSQTANLIWLNFFLYFFESGVRRLLSEPLFFFRRLPISNFAIRFLWDFRVCPKAQTKQEPLMQRRFPIIAVYYLKIIRFLGGRVFFSRKFYAFEGFFFLNGETVVGKDEIILYGWKIWAKRREAEISRHYIHIKWEFNKS